MPFGGTESGRREAGRWHAKTIHTCKCGRVIRGNAIHCHKKVCKVWLEWKQKRDGEFYAKYGYWR